MTLFISRSKKKIPRTGCNVHNRLSRKVRIYRLFKEHSVIRTAVFRIPVLLMTGVKISNMLRNMKIQIMIKYKIGSKV